MKNPAILIAYPVKTEAEQDHFCIDLRLLGYDTDLTTNASGIEKAIATMRYRAIVIAREIWDAARKGGDGYMIASRLKKTRLSTPIIVLDPSCKSAEDCMSDTGVYVIPDTLIHLEYFLASLFYPERVEQLRAHVLRTGIV